MASSVRFLDLPCLRVTGPDRVTWLNGLLTCDVTRASTGRSVWGLLLSKQGKIQAEVVVVALEQELILGVRGGDADRVVATLDQYLVMEDAEIERAEDDLGWVVFIEGGEDRLSRDALLERFPDLLWVGEVFWRVPAEDGSPSEPSAWNPKAYLALRRKPGTPGAFEDFGPELSAEDWSRARIAWGVPTFGTDFSEADNPHEASLERRTVDWKKGCYLGQEVVCMQDMRGKVKRRLVTLRWPAAGSGSDHAAPPSAGGAKVGADLVGTAVLDAAGRELGRVTSVSAVGALAMVKAPAYEPGTRVRVGLAPNTFEAVVCGLGTPDPS